MLRTKSMKLQWGNAAAPLTGTAMSAPAPPARSGQKNVNHRVNRTFCSDNLGNAFPRTPIHISNLGSTVKTGMLPCLAASRAVLLVS